MGWQWVDEPSDSLPLARGLWSVDELENPNPVAVEDRCSTRRIASTSCQTEEVEPGRFITTCENKEEIFRSCVGRPTELVKSRIEQTEDDITYEIQSGMIPFEYPAPSNYLPGGFSNLPDAAEEMANDLFTSVNIPSLGNRKSPFFDHPEKQTEQDVPKKDDSSLYSEISGEIKDVQYIQSLNSGERLLWAYAWKEWLLPASLGFNSLWCARANDVVLPAPPPRVRMAAIKPLKIPPSNDSGASVDKPCHRLRFLMLR